METPLSLKGLKTLVDGGAVAIRGKATLEPAGGAGDKVFPSTYTVGDREKRAGAKYAFEKRRLSTGEAACVLLDSVQSQANRMEEALQDLWEQKRLTLPVLEVDFKDVAPEVGRITSLSAPHRVADAILRDSLLDGTFFRFSELGRSFTDATPRNAAPLFRICPTALVFGLWDSTGPKGGLGSKFARALVSEIIGVGAEHGVKTESRVDPLGIVKAAGPIFVAKEPGPDGQPTWTLNVLDAKPLDADKPPKTPEDSDRVRKWGDKDKAGKPSSIVHGNVAPSIDALGGGVTIDHAEHTVVLSVAALRKLSFGEGDSEARTALAALGLLAVLAAGDRGHDLRSRCLLVPRKGEALKFEIIEPNGNTRPLLLSLEEAVGLFESAVRALPESLSFTDKDGRPLQLGVPVAVLKPSEKLAQLVKKSRELAAVGEEIAEG